MHRIDGAGATIDNRFTEGNPQTGTPATSVTDDWLNDVQENLCTVIEQAGIPLAKGDWTQLYDAIQALIAAKVNFTTGDAKLTLKTAADSGWVMADDGTIGNVGSGATTRANTDAHDLFVLVWNNISNTFAPIYDSAGSPVSRGATAEDDWTANRRLSLTKNLGRALAVAGAGAGLTGRALGETLGEETHVLSEAEMPAHSHQLTGYTVFTGGGAGNTSAGGLTYASNPNTNSKGSSQAHNNMQPSTFWNVMIRL